MFRDFCLALRLCLILALIVTGQAAASARGQAMAGGEMVICAGAAVTTIRVDAGGRPVEGLHYCPDMALGLMAAIAVAHPDLPLPESIGRTLVCARASLTAARPAPDPRGRGPPMLHPDAT